MVKVILSLALLLVSSVFSTKIAMVTESEEDFDKEFNILENDSARQMNAKNLAKVEEEINQQNQKYNNGKSSFSEKLNAYSELTGDELEHEREGVIAPATMQFMEDKVVGGIIDAPESEKNDPENIAKVEAFYKQLERSNVPAEFSSYERGFVTKVKDQRTCGSCAAFATAAAIEACMLSTPQNKVPVQDMDLSEQFMVDCGYDPKQDIDGCEGAQPKSYPEWFVKHAGGYGVHEHSYAYIGNLTDYTCQKKPMWMSGSQVVNYVIDYQCTEEKMKKLIVNFGSVIAFMNATDGGFNNYGQGVWANCRPNSRSYKYNHAVMIFGYGSRNGADFWMAKNSWGTTWGESGLFRIARGVDMCAVERTCVAVQCAGGLPAQRPPPPPPPPVIPQSLYCDMNAIFPGVNGMHTLRIGNTGLVKQYISEVVCKNGICAPKNPNGIHNACVYICGEIRCGR